ncbi:MAG: hypothetical protein J6W28_02890 [Clostridia bacterium]|nr:hypothetical protein [Clostridia bacterium]
MENFTVSLFGHREIDDLRGLERKLSRRIEELLRRHEYVTIFIGRNGEFDEYAASVVKRTQKRLGTENSELTLVLPYRVADVEFYEKYYDSVIIPESVYGAHPKQAITLKNRWMVEQSDLVIVYVERNTGGAFAAMQYARKTKKETVNLFLTDEEED